ncbi:MAG: STM3941 family protein [Bacteroidales bacterium]
MTENGQIEIPLSKKKMTLTLLGSIIFVGLGIWFLINPPKINNPIFGNPTVIFIVGLASILFFGLVAITVFRKLSDKKAGLIINKQGIIDNSSGVSAGLVLWTDIEEIKVSQVMSQKFLMFIVKNPQDYLDKVTNPLKRKGMEMNYKTYGSPISISANSLQTNFDELYNLLTEKQKEYKS